MRVIRRDAYATAITGELQQESGQLKTGLESLEATIINHTVSETNKNVVHYPLLRKVEISIVRDRNQIEDCNSSVFIDAFPKHSPKGERNLSAIIEV